MSIALRAIVARPRTRPLAAVLTVCALLRWTDIKHRLLGRHRPDDRLFLGAIFLIRASLIIAAVGAVFNLSWLVALMSIAALLLTFIPSLFEQRYKVDIPIELELVIVLFIYGALFLGEAHGYYTRFWWWDLVLHGSSGIILGLFGFLILVMMYSGGRIAASPRLIALLAFCFGLALGTLWEIYEFFMDYTFGLTMQSGLIDTMADLIVDAVGALIASVLGYLYIRNSGFKLFDRIVARVMEHNPRWFGK